MPKPGTQRREKHLFNPYDPNKTKRDLVNFIKLRADPGELKGTIDANTPLDVLQTIAAKLAIPERQSATHNDQASPAAGDEADFSANPPSSDLLSLEDGAGLAVLKHVKSKKTRKPRESQAADQVGLEKGAKPSGVTREKNVRNAAGPEKTRASTGTNASLVDNEGDPEKTRASAGANASPVDNEGNPTGSGEEPEKGIALQGSRLKRSAARQTRADKAAKTRRVESAKSRPAGPVATNEQSSSNPAGTTQPPIFNLPDPEVQPLTASQADRELVGRGGCRRKASSSRPVVQPKANVKTPCSRPVPRTNVKEDRYLISPTDLGLGGSPSRATEPEPFIVFEPDNILEQSSPEDTARLAKWPPLLKHVPKGAFVYRKSLRQEDSCANYPFREVVEDELKQLYSRMKNNGPSEETLGMSVVQPVVDTPRRNAFLRPKSTPRTFLESLVIRGLIPTVPSPSTPQSCLQPPLSPLVVLDSPEGQNLIRRSWGQGQQSGTTVDVGGSIGPAGIDTGENQSSSEPSEPGRASVRGRTRELRVVTGEWEEITGPRGLGLASTTPDRPKPRADESEYQCD
ncbi:uncharacterized protein PGTG_02442 [Puccinia graminis f. sp. tritici CRL 75-36-700-3]|uniref:Uncharacterized protein n=1 Tax=Puccinia graminis f. sp. tritici (strain CRL 75-36-700-3 / race SCCL) TaxID=418459 RepID=E3JY56_PUCGT|nr:uncharacterized protein PGTG_02442 [Puccinia graminis f. sp. tritici CRL 75-36-700-3]EFP76981.2 hypothetical protein PGTG_02442 [Puccinia graminis f. sp. tritici CRL 75-36-700-3]